MGDMEFNGTPEEWDALVKKNKEQETLEEAAERLYPGVDRQVDRILFINGAKWQAERMYSEEEVIKLLTERCKYFGTSLSPFDKILLKQDLEWFEQFKKK